MAIGRYGEKALKVMDYLENCGLLPYTGVSFGNIDNFRTAIVSPARENEHGGLAIFVSYKNDPLFGNPLFIATGDINAEVILEDIGRKGFGAVDAAGYKLSQEEGEEAYVDAEGEEKIKIANELYQKIINKTLEQIDNPFTRSFGESLDSLIEKLEA